MQKTKYVKLFCGILFKEFKQWEKANKVLQKKFGIIDYHSNPKLFSFTNYYEKEMGSLLYRMYISFTPLIHAYELASIKKYTNRLEKKLSVSKRRTVNIDPGYISLGNLVLATTKNYSHRLPISKTIFGEITLIYEFKDYKIMPWTYPDYKDPENINHFKNMRILLHDQLKEHKFKSSYPKSL